MLTVVDLKLFAGSDIQDANGVRVAKHEFAGIWREGQSSYNGVCAFGQETLDGVRSFRRGSLPQLDGVTATDGEPFTIRGNRNSCRFVCSFRCRREGEEKDVFPGCQIPHVCS